MNLFSKGVVNLALRGVSTGSKFLLVIHITRNYTLDELGVYGMFNTIIALGMLFLGLEFSQYTTRELITKDRKASSNILYNQFIFHLISYLFLLPIFYVCFIYNFLPLEYLLIFYLVLIVEHLTNELFKIFIALSKQVLANIILFVKTGFWIFVLIGVFYLFPDAGYSEFKSVFLLWLGGSLLALVIGVYYLFSQGLIRKPFKIDRSLLIEGLKIGLPFFFATISLKLIEYNSRFYIDIWGSKEDVGIFTFIFNISNILNITVYSLIVIQYYPLLIQHYFEDRTRYQAVRKKFRNILFGATFGVALCILAGYYPLTAIIDNDFLVEYKFEFYLLIISNIIYCLSLYYHYVLYAVKEDKFIFTSTIATLGFNLISNYFLISKYLITGAAVSLILSLGFLLILKFIRVRTVNSKES